MKRELVAGGASEREKGDGIFAAKIVGSSAASASPKEPEDSLVSMTMPVPVLDRARVQELDLLPEHHLLPELIESAGEQESEGENALATVGRGMHRRVVAAETNMTDIHVADTKVAASAPLLAAAVAGMPPSHLEAWLQAAGIDARGCTAQLRARLLAALLHVRNAPSSIVAGWSAVGERQVRTLVAENKRQVAEMIL
jgi:hypothetical protein